MSAGTGSVRRSSSWATSSAWGVSSRLAFALLVAIAVLLLWGSASPSSASSVASGERLGDGLVLRGAAGVPAGVAVPQAGVVAGGAGASWVSGKLGASMGGLSVRASSLALEPLPSESPSSSSSATPSSPASCDSSRGTYPYPDPAPSSAPLPSWASGSESLRCVVVVHTVNDPDAEAPGPTPGELTLSEELAGLRQVMLFSGGLVVLLLGALLIRGRW